MGTMLKAAKMNDLISKHPMDGVRFTKPVRTANDIKFLTRENQRIFLEAARRSHNYNQYALILETGLRTGELIASVCTRCATPTLRGRSKAGCSPRCCKSCWDTAA